MLVRCIVLDEVRVISVTVWRGGVLPGSVDELRVVLGPELCAAVIISARGATSDSYPALRTRRRVARPAWVFPAATLIVEFFQRLLRPLA